MRRKFNKKIIIKDVLNDRYALVIGNEGILIPVVLLLLLCCFLGYPYVELEMIRKEFEADMESFVFDKIGGMVEKADFEVSCPHVPIISNQLCFSKTLSQ